MFLKMLQCLQENTLLQHRSFLWILRNFLKQLFYRTPPVAAFDFWKHYERALINVFVVLQRIEKNFGLVFFTIGLGTNRFLLAVNTFKICLENVGSFIRSSLFPAAMQQEHVQILIKMFTVNLETCSKVIINTLYLLYPTLFCCFLCQYRTYSVYCDKQGKSAKV